jgi:hypothetical protein
MKILFIIIIILLITILIYNKKSYDLNNLYLNPNPFQNEKIRKGLIEMNNNSIIICGLARDCEKNILTNIEWLKHICNFFKDYKIIIVENDSADNTRKILLDWANNDSKVVILGCGINAEKCNLNMYKTNGICDVSQKRINKMCKLRNIYINYIKTIPEINKYKYTMIIDPDIKGRFYIDGIINSIYHLSSNINIDGLSANSISSSLTNYYYDTFAYVPLNYEKLYFNNVFEKIIHDFKVLLLVDFKNENKPIKVKSAFGGICIYKTNKILTTNAIYDYSKIGYSCEHSYFHKDMNIYINPLMLGIIVKH